MNNQINPNNKSQYTDSQAKALTQLLNQVSHNNPPKQNTNSKTITRSLEPVLNQVSHFAPKPVIPQQQSNNTTIPKK